MGRVDHSTEVLRPTFATVAMKHTVSKSVTALLVFQEENIQFMEQTLT